MHLYVFRIYMHIAINIQLVIQFINVTGRRTDRISMIIKEVFISIVCLIIKHLAALVILLATLTALLSGYVVVQFLSICSSAVSIQLINI